MFRRTKRKLHCLLWPAWEVIKHHILFWLKQSQKPTHFQEKETWIPTLDESGVKVTLWEVHNGWEMVLQTFWEKTICHSGAGRQSSTGHREESGYLLNTNDHIRMPLAFWIGLYIHWTHKNTYWITVLGGVLKHMAKMGNMCKIFIEGLLLVKSP